MKTVYQFTKSRMDYNCDLGDYFATINNVSMVSLGTKVVFVASHTDFVFKVGAFLSSLEAPGKEVRCQRN